MWDLTSYISYQMGAQAVNCQLSKWRKIQFQRNSNNHLIRKCQQKKITFFLSLVSSLTQTFRYSFLSSNFPTLFFGFFCLVRWFFSFLFNFSDMEYNCWRKYKAKQPAIKYNIWGHNEIYSAIVRNFSNKATYLSLSSKLTYQSNGCF